MKTPTQGALRSNSVSRGAAVCMLTCTLFASMSLEAQEVTRVYPRYVIAGQETHFTVEGKNLPIETSATLGMRYSFAKPATCSSSRQDKPPTASRYYFSCIIKSKTDKARFSILHQPKVKSKRKTKPADPIELWEGTLQVLPAAPRVSAVSLLGELETGQSIVTCNPSQTCTIVVGDLHSGKPITIDVSGSNLPTTLQIGFAGCKSSFTTSELQNKITRSFTCTPRLEGDQVIRILSAAQNERGVELIASTVAVQKTITTLGAP